MNRPTTFPNVEQVPGELRPLKRWCAYRKFWDEGAKKFKKPPYSPVDGSAIGATEKYLEHFLDFEAALEGAKRHNLDGPGFVFMEGDDYVGVDFDDCRNPETGEIDPVVKSWLNWLPSYAEVSPSGTGVHVILKGKLARAVTAKQVPDAAPGVTIEAYCNGRYFTFSGNKLSESPLEVIDCQAGVDKLLASIGETSASSYEPRRTEYGPMSRETARKVYANLLASFGAMTQPSDPQNDTLNSCAFFAAKAYAAGALEQTEQQLKDELRAIAKSTPSCAGIESTIRSGWDKGITSR